MRKKVYIVADSMVSSLGTGTAANVGAIRSGRSGVMAHDGLLRDESGKGLPVMCSLVPEGMCPETEGFTKGESMALTALKDVMQSRPPQGKTAMVFSSTKGNIGILDKVPSTLPKDVFLAETAQKIGREYGFAPEDVYTVSNACISGVSSLVAAKRMIEYGFYDSAVVVGVDTLSEFIVSGFASFRSLSGELCRPYDESRCGLNLGEAAGALLLTSGTALCCDASCTVLSGGSISDDANHISGPSRTGDALFFAMRDAMEDAGVSAGDISFVNLHGTATAYNDEMESKAVALAGLSQTPAQSLKPYIGHTLGASGVVETVLCIRQLHCGEVWGTPGFETLGVPMPLNVSAQTRKTRMRHCLKTASGFGGCNAAIVLSLPEFAHDLPARALTGVKVVRETALSSSMLSDGRAPGEVPVTFHDFIREKYKSLGLNDMKFYKMDDMSKLGYIAAHLLLDGMDFGPEDMAVILSNRSASLDTDLKHLRNITEGPGASPAVFVYTLPNVASGEISIRHKIKGENTFFISSTFREDAVRNYVRMCLSSSKAVFCMAGWLEFLGDEWAVNLKLYAKD